MYEIDSNFICIFFGENWDNVYDADIHSLTPTVTF